MVVQKPTTERASRIVVVTVSYRTPEGNTCQKRHEMVLSAARYQAAGFDPVVETIRGNYAAKGYVITEMRLHEPTIH